MNSKILYLAAAVGAYMFRAQIESALGFGTAPAAPPPTLPPPTGPNPYSFPTAGVDPTRTNPTGVGTSNPFPPAILNVTPPPPVVTSPLSTLPVTADTLTKASYDAATAQLLGNNANGMLNWDQWNYYRNASGRPQISVDMFDPNNRGELITAVEYQRRVAQGQAAGTISALSGLRYANR